MELVWTKYGNGFAIGVRAPQEDSKIIERIYNTCYNYGVTGGNLHTMNEGRFAYFLVAENKIDKLKGIPTKLGQLLTDQVKKNFIREDFLQAYNGAANYVVS